MFCAVDGTKLIDEAGSSVPANPFGQPQYPGAPQFVASTPPTKNRWLAVISVVLGSFACALLLYLAAQMMLRPYTFRARYISIWTLGFDGLALTLGVLLTVIAVLSGIAALVLSFMKRDRFGGRIPAVIGPVISILACALALGLFAFRRVQGPPTYYSPPSMDSPSSEANSNSNSNSAPRSSSTNMTDEEKYRLFYAATKTEDKFLQSEAAKKIGIIDSSGRPTTEYKSFVANATSWAINDVAFIRSVDTPAKARAYVNAHMDY